MALNINDVRAQMPNYENYKDWQRDGKILGIAVHHSASADRSTGAPIGNAQSFFNYHVNVRGWVHGGYNYVITGSGQIEYALDEKISAYHAGFKDPDNSEGLEYGQYWNNHFLAVCLAGWFSDNRTYQDSGGQVHQMPNQYTSPTEAQMQSLLALIKHLRSKYNIPVENIRGHRELRGNGTTCPGHNFDPAELRAKVREADQPESPTDPQPEVAPGEHVVLLPDADRYLNAALTYIWHFKPDVSFAIGEAKGRWKYVSAVGTEDAITESQLAQLRSGGAEIVQRISGTPDGVRAILDELVEENTRFLETEQPEPEPKPEPKPETYTVQPGDSLSRISLQVYGTASLWPIIFEANRNILNDPSRIRPGQVLIVPPKPE